MKELQIRELVKKQQDYFLTGATLDISFRKNALKKLKNIILENEAAIHAALRLDLGKSGFESYMCETGLVLSEIGYMLKHMSRFAREKRVRTPLAQFCSRSYKKPSPYGVTLIMSPWNYPFLLTMEPLVDALTAGNTAILKPSAYSPHTSALMEKLISQCFAPEYVALVTGGRAENTALLDTPFDYIFFTGSMTVGKEVMKKASAHLTPVTLELGGKSPCLVDKSANLRLTAKRLVFGKYLNCGQTCVAPDYVYCDAGIKDQLLEEIKIQIRKQYGDFPLDNIDYGKIVNEKHFHRILTLIDSQKVVLGGNSNPKTLQIEPTVMDRVSFEDPVMQEEIFGPVMPILTFQSLEEAIARIQSLPHPLALYLFSSDRSAIQKVTASCGFGGGCINDTIIHLATSQMPFGGFGASGMGSYHGKDGFDTFTHYKSIVDKKTWIDLPMRYQPYTDSHNKMIHFFLK